MEIRRLLELTAGRAADFLEGMDERSVFPHVTADALREAFGGPLPEGPTDPVEVVEALARDGGAGAVASPSGRYFGFVVGGSIPAALAADWLTSTWDQNAGLYAIGPAASVAEEVAGGWLKELLGLPPTASYAFVTGCQMAHVTALAAARYELLRRAGWSVARDGLFGAPRVRVIVGEHVHVTVTRALRLLGLGEPERVTADDQGRMDAPALREALARDGGPAIVCAQAGDVNTGAFDPLTEISDAAGPAGAWLHVDGAFGMWAAAAPSLRHLVDGIERADSWATDGHKWLNVPYDNGLAFCAHPDAHRAAMGVQAAYLVHADGEDAPRDPVDWTPEFSRRARGFTVYAALRSLGRAGVAQVVERCCAHARRFAELLGAEEGVEVLNDVVLNQVLVRFLDDDDATRAVIARVQDEGVAWMGGTTWRGRAAMRISVSNWQTSDADVEATVGSILSALRETAVPRVS